MLSFLKPRLLSGALALMLGTSAHAAHYKVFLLGGQSNMFGNNTKLSGLTEAQKTPQEDVLFYFGGTSNFTPAVMMNLQPGGGSAFGPELTFGRTIADARPVDNFCLIKFAQGGTNLHTDWDPATGSRYNMFRTAVTYGLDALTKAGHTYEIVGMLWTQGERDAAHGRTTAEYEADLNEFIADIRTRYGANVSFFISRLSVLQTARPITEVRAAQENVAASDPNAYLIDTDAMGMQGDNLHFDAAGQVSLGQAFGQAYLNSLPVDSTAPTISTLSPAHMVSGVDPTADLTITFTEDITFGTGAIRLMQTGGTPVETFDVASSSANLTLSGAAITINPTAILSPTTGYYLEIDATAINDLAGNSFWGISGEGTWSFTTSVADTTAPAIASLSPAHTAAGVLFNSNLRISFSENIALGTGEIRLRQAGGALIQSFDVANPPAGLSLSGKTLTINPSADFSAASGYHVEIDATAIYDLAGNSFPGFLDDGIWSFTTADPLIDGSLITATASKYSPTGAGDPGWHPYRSIDGTGLSGGEHGTGQYAGWMTSFVDPSNEWIQWDLGASYTLDAIHVWNLNNQGNNGFSIKSVDIYFSNVSNPGNPEGAGAANWTKLGAAPVELPQAPATGTPNTGFDLASATSTTLPETEIRFVRFELNSNWTEAGSYNGLAEIQFTAKPGGPDLTSPAMSLLSPAHTAAGVALASDLSITFNENVAFGTGAIRLRRQSDDSVIESFDVEGPSAGLTISGDTVTLNPTADLSPATTYYIEIEATAIDDLAGNSFAGFADDGTWRFTTFVPDTTDPEIDSLSPANGATGISLGGNLSVRFSEGIVFGTGSITLRQSGGTPVESFNVGLPSSGLTLSGDTITINPTASLSLATTYYIEIDATAINDHAGNSFAGFTENGTWSFTTTNAVSAATPSADSIAVQGNGYNPDPTGAVGRNANGLYEIRTVLAFSVADIVSNTSMGLADFGTTPFDLNFIAANAISLTAGQTYQVDYLGFHDNVAALGEAFFDPRYGTTATSTIDTGIEDSAAAGQEIKAIGLTLSDVTGTDANDYVVFRIRYNQTANSTIQQLNGFTLSSVISANDTFTDWIGGFTGLGGLSAFGDDADGDGIKNGIENYFGTHPGEFSQGLVAQSLSNNTFTFTHPLNDSPATNIGASYRWSKDLSGFHADGATHEGTTVSFTQSEPVDGMVSVTATITGTLIERLFVDLEVTLQ